MSLEFETTYQYTRPTGSATTTFIIKVSAVEVWVGWSDGAITSHTSLNLHHTLDISYYFDNQTVALPGINIINTTAGLVIPSMTRWYDSVWGLFTWPSSTKNILKINISSRAITSIDLPAGLTYAQINSNLCAADGKLVLVDKNVNANDQNTFWIYNIGTDTWTSGVLPGKKQSTPRHIVDGLDGRIYVTGQNDHSIIVISYGGTASTMYKVNRHPYKLQVNQNKDLFVIADLSTTNNTISLFNQSSNTAATFCSGLKSTTVLDDFRTGTMWLGGGGSDTVRLLRSDVGAITAGVVSTQGISPIGDTMALTDNFTYDYYNPVDNTTTALTVRPHLFITTATTVTAYRATALKGVNSSQILGTAMIATGAQGYYGG